jgi:superfamily II DNA or RNA helicase
MKPTKYQIEAVELGYSILKEHMIVYLAMEERVGKTIPSIMIAEMCSNVNSVLVATKKKAVEDWRKLLRQFPHTKKYNVTNYHQLHKFGRPGLLILDEAHNYISGYPEQSAMHRNIQENISPQIPIIYLSATPHAQGYQMLYHQFALSSWSPWRRYKDFYSWFKVYGIPDHAWFNDRQVPVYTTTKEEQIKAETDHLFITKTRKAAGFRHEPVDQLHYIQLSSSTKSMYNELMKHRFLTLGKYELVCDTPMKFRTALHMLEGGVAKIDNTYLVLSNDEKIQYILNTWGDTEDIVIFYHYIAEGTKLRKVFKKATILQGVSYAEGIDLTHKDTIIVYSQNFSTAKHTQRRARQASMHRDKPITVHFLLVRKAVSEQVYEAVAINKINFVDSVFERNYI